MLPGLTVFFFSLGYLWMRTNVQKIIKNKEKLCAKEIYLEKKKK